jgi:hypothetical protein
MNILQMLDSVYQLVKVAKCVRWITKVDRLLCLVKVVMFFRTAVEITIVCTLKELYIQN